MAFNAERQKWNETMRNFDILATFEYLVRLSPDCHQLMSRDAVVIAEQMGSRADVQKFAETLTPPAPLAGEHFVRWTARRSNRPGTATFGMASFAHK